MPLFFQELHQNIHLSKTLNRADTISKKHIPRLEKPLQGIGKKTAAAWGAFCEWDPSSFFRAIQARSSFSTIFHFKDMKKMSSTAGAWRSARTAEAFFMSLK
ncbi:MAG: hypothetical protein B7Y39_08695 [Bdellovibrio sp. 28-41-41]|nr:MAG: hypothetical protein B7Y39_08695 [Bdellovibrio sp. 28-41-41]